MLNHRLQVLIDDERHDRLVAEASRRGVAVAELVREAIDDKLAVENGGKLTIWQELESAFDADPMSVPESVEELRAEIDSMHDATMR